MSEPEVPGSIDTMGGEPNQEAIRAAMSRIGAHSAERLNAVAFAVTDVLGYTMFSRRYAIAVLALDALDKESQDSSKGAST